MKRILMAAAILTVLLTACGQKDSIGIIGGADGPTEVFVSSASSQKELSTEEKIERVQSLIDKPVDDLYQAIGEPDDSAYASSCLGEGQDGELYYDGFTVYTYLDPDGNESVYDVMETAASED